MAHIVPTLNVPQVLRNRQFLPNMAPRTARRAQYLTVNGLALVMSIVSAHSNIQRLPIEVIAVIHEYMQPQNNNLLHSPWQARATPVHPAAIPPANGSCPLLGPGMPTEIRKAIFAASLPDKETPIEPHCTSELLPRRIPPQKHNKTSDLMVLNRKISQEVSLVVYEERKFIVHVHGGLSIGGIEFCNSGRQPLHYLAHAGDSRFARFAKGDQFGFHRVKKLEIVIFEPSELGRHDALNLYHMHIALCILLHRPKDSKSGRIVSLTIRFDDTKRKTAEGVTNRQDIMRAESYWWDPDNDRARSTSIHGLSDVELVLRPFAHLYHIHKVQIILPSQVDQHHKTATFARNLASSMQSELGTLHEMTAELELKMEMARQAMEDYMFSLKHGGLGTQRKMVSDKEFDEDKGAWDDGKGGAGGPTTSPKHGLSSESRERGLPIRTKRQKTVGFVDLTGEDEGEDSVVDLTGDDEDEVDGEDSRMRERQRHDIVDLTNSEETEQEKIDMRRAMYASRLDARTRSQNDITRTAPSGPPTFGDFIAREPRPARLSSLMGNHLQRMSWLDDLQAQQQPRTMPALQNFPTSAVREERSSISFERPFVIRGSLSGRQRDRASIFEVPDANEEAP